ncbi:MAG: MBOAT family O-acyltransferase [Gammaproteobacteria bacterium]
MIFNSNVFLLAFLPIVFILFWSFRTKTARYVLLATAGFVFYGWWNWRYCFLLLFSSLVSFTAGLAISRSADPKRRRLIMIAAIAADLTILGFFKYYNFFASTVNALAPDGGLLPMLHVVLPIGISFYTFHTISYIVDVQNGRVRATNNLWEYLTYVNLFSQLVAGPIVRFRQIEADLEKIDGPPREDWIARGIGFFVIGLAKKVIIADQIAAGINPILAAWPELSFAAAWITALGYTCQLYFDFSGYSDMAVGLGYLFGLRIPQNFNSPYRALGIQDFWRRWHISLSSWLRDYLYYPLGGNRKGPARTYINLMIVMLLGGLWHGANWTFVAWGAYHGLLLIMDRILEPFFTTLPKLVYRLQTFLFVMIGWVLFRSSSFTMALHWLHQMFSPDRRGIPSGINSTIAWIGVAIGLIILVPEAWEFRFSTRLRWAIAYAAAFMVCYLFMNGAETVFLYYQF